MMAIAVGGNATGDAPVGAAAGGDVADEANVVANDAAGGAAEAPQVPQSLPPSSPETEWVVPDPVSTVADWRPWPYVHVHFSEPESPPFLPEQTFLYEEPVEFGPVPRPTEYVDPDDIEPIFFGPQPRPIDYVEPDFEVPIFFGPQPRPDNYVEPEELDVIISMEDDTIHDGFHVESPVQSNDAPKPTVDAAGRAEDLYLLTILSDKLDRRARTQFHTPVFVRFRSTISTGVPSPTVVLELAASYVTSDTAGPSVLADKGKAHMPDLDIPAEFLTEDAQAKKRLEEEQDSERLVQ
nr:hypothetical protein [Tanacetum cinerariifolium]